MGKINLGQAETQKGNYVYTTLTNEIETISFRQERD